MATNKHLHIAISGGSTSGLMAIHIANSERYKHFTKVFVFCNTGRERQETIDFLKNIEQTIGFPIFCLEYHNKSYVMKDWHELDMRGKPFSEVINRFGYLPTRTVRYCTNELKIKIAHKFCTDFFGTTKYLSAIGIRSDEQHRVRNDKKIIYPLVDMNVTKQIVTQFWSKMPYKLELPQYLGNCDLCYLKSSSKRIEILKNNPEIAQWWSDWEKKTGRAWDVSNGKFVNELVPDDKEFDCFCSNT